MRKLLIKSFVLPFYKAFFGFFILVFIIFGMLMEVRQHILIGERILKHPIAFSTLLLVFSFYGWIQYRFHIRLIQGNKYQLFHQMALLKSLDFSRYQLLVWVYNHLLLLVYAIFLSLLSLNFGYLAQPIGLWILLIGMYFVHRKQLFNMLGKPFPNQRPTLLKKLRRKNYQIGREYWLIYHLKENRLLLLVACKGINLILLKLFFYSFATGAYDERWLQFGVLCAAFINFPIWFEKIEFEQDKLKTLLNLPRTIIGKIRIHFYSTLQIIAPEILYISIQIPSLPIAMQGLMLLFLIFSLNLGIYALINFTSIVHSLAKNAIMVFFSLFFLIIYSFPTVLISILAIAVFFKSIRSPYMH